ncbi:hypothetical protein B296_00030071 [Ensete ventricosum]|uniref:Uncharacterized protein n=1 Tax=Ensete ventricosum TaxID=4639 RepID=A0A426Y2K2_ENSVE|nr:hypothetical protein B296_00030071 [Ensete ventricosum]
MSVALPRFQGECGQVSIEAKGVPREVVLSEVDFLMMVSLSLGPGEPPGVASSAMGRAAKCKECSLGASLLWLGLGEPLKSLEGHRQAPGGPEDDVDTDVVKARQDQFGSEIIHGAPSSSGCGGSSLPSDLLHDTFFLSQQNYSALFEAYVHEMQSDRMTEPEIKS